MTSRFEYAVMRSKARRACREEGHLQPRQTPPLSYRILECPRCWAFISWPTTDARPDHGEHSRTG